MSSDNSESNPPSPTARPRRPSLVETFGGRPNFDASSNTAGTTGNGGTHKPGSLANAMAQQSRARRLSVTTMGLSGSPTHGPMTGSAFETLRDKSLRESSSGGSDEAIEDEDGVAPLNGDSGSRPTSPSLGRRLSFGARAHGNSMRASSGSAVDNGGSQDSVAGSPASAGGANGGGSAGGSSGKAASPPGSGRKEGFNWSDRGTWSETLRTRAASRSSISAGTGVSGFLPLAGRSQSVVEPGPSAIPPPAPQPKSPPPKAPDHFQERILKGDFYMD